MIGWMIARIGGVGGLFFPFGGTCHRGAAIVCTFGTLLILISFGGLLRRRPEKLEIFRGVTATYNLNEMES
ncbi:MAG TPA: hypothetical protein VGQ82_02230 [Chthoniobacterales bacterium]|nr:hypothetical protein [Chthoniobacterales bacterium]